MNRAFGADTSSGNYVFSEKLSSLGLSGALLLKGGLSRSDRNKTSETKPDSSALRTLNEAENKTDQQVSPRKSTRDVVRDIHTGEDGKLYDAVTGVQIKPGESWHMGHKPGFELRKMKVDAADRKISRKEYIEEQNNPNIYQPELPRTSSSGTHEAPNNVSLPAAVAGGVHEDKY